MEITRKKTAKIGGYIVDITIDGKGIDAMYYADEERNHQVGNWFKVLEDRGCDVIDIVLGIICIYNHAAEIRKNIS